MTLGRSELISSEVWCSTETHKEILRQLIWKIFGKSVQGIEALPVLSGPLKGKALPKQPAMEQISVLFGRYEPAVTSEIFHLPETTKVAYDVGANVGYMTLALAHRIKNGGHVFAFEPVPTNIEFLRKMCSLNGLDKRVEVLPLALGNKAGEQKLVMWGSSTMHLLEAALNGQDTSCCPSIVVESSTLDSFVFERNNPPPDLIKIDVEGAEALVLEGALRTLSTYSPSIIMEIHGPANAKSVWEILAGLSYNWQRLTDKGRSRVLTEANLVSYFSKYCWTNHFLLTKTNGAVSAN
jgi:FkbM family methyltransferase